MSTAAYPTKGPNLVVLLLIVMTLFFLAFGTALAVMGSSPEILAAAPAAAAPRIIWEGNDHQYAHPEAEAIHQCVDKNGPYQVWHNKFDSDTFYNLCQLPDGRWGLEAFRKVGRQLFGKTAFVKGNGSWSEMVRYMQSIATRFTGSVVP